MVGLPLDWAIQVVLRPADHGCITAGQLRTASLQAAAALRAEGFLDLLSVLVLVVVVVVVIVVIDSSNG